MTKHVTSCYGAVDVRNHNLNIVIPEEDPPLDLLDPLYTRDHSECDLVRALSQVQLLQLLISGDQTLDLYFLSIFFDCLWGNLTST